MSLTLAMAIVAGIGAVASAAGGVYSRYTQRQARADDASNKMLMIEGQREDLAAMKDFNISQQNQLFESVKGSLNKSIGRTKIMRANNANIASIMGISQNKMNYLQLGQLKGDSISQMGNTVQHVATSGFRQSANTTNMTIAQKDQLSMKYSIAKENAAMSSAQSFTSAMSNYLGATAQIDNYNDKIEQARLSKDMAVAKINKEFEIQDQNIQNQYDYYSDIYNDESKYDWDDFWPDLLGVSADVANGSTEVMSIVNNGSVASAQKDLYTAQLKYYTGE